MTPFPDFGVYGWYIWMSYAVAAAVIGAEAVAVRARLRRARLACRSATPATAPRARYDAAAGP